jgi:predicted Mrr-cat superfamily restriction endonuclease
MTIWALKGPSSGDYDEEEEYAKVLEFLSNSIRNGTSRFGWGFVDTADLTKLRDKPWQEMTEKEQVCWSQANFLLEVKKGDWVIHINLPYWGACFAGQIIEEYSFEQKDNEFGDYRHTFKLDPNSIVEFERNDDAVLPIIGSRLKLQGRYWRIQYAEEFLQTIQNIKAGSLGKKDNESIGIFYLKQDLSPLLKDVTKKIQKAHPGGKLESFIAEVLRKVPNVISVTEHGKHKGWGTDNGADLIVAYKSGLSFSNLEKEEKLVVQVKSFTGQHWETNAVEQIKDALNEFEAATGLIITTAESTENLEKAIEALSNELKKPIGLIAGQEVAKFVLKYGGELIL